MLIANRASSMAADCQRASMPFVIFIKIGIVMFKYHVEFIILNFGPMDIDYFWALRLRSVFIFLIIISYNLQN